MYEERGVSSVNRLLIESARYNNKEGVKNALALRADVNYSGTDYVTALHISSEKGYTDLVEFLVTVRGIKLNLQTSYGNSPLSLSIYHNHYKITRILLKAGADPDALIIFDQTALHVATFNGRLHSVKELIKYKADVNVIDCFDRTPLYISLISHPSATITYLLLKAGANPNAKGCLNLSLLTLACIGAHNYIQTQAIETLIHFGADVNEKDGKGETPLHKAALKGYIPVINLLVKSGSNIFETNDWGQTALDIAKVHKNVGAIVLLEELEDEQILMELTMLEISTSELGDGYM